MSRNYPTPFVSIESELAFGYEEAGCLGKDLAVAVAEHGQHTRACSYLRRARHAALPIQTPLLNARLEVAEMAIEFDEDRFEDLRTRLERSRYLHRCAGQSRLCTSKLSSPTVVWPMHQPRES